MALSPLDEELAQAAGWQDEEAGNAAFDPAEYIDVMTATGHKPVVVLDDTDEAEWYIEELPRRRLSDDESRRWMQVRWKFVRASTALERVTAECLRRGLVVDRRQRGARR